MIRPNLMSDVNEVLGSHSYLLPQDFSVREYPNQDGPCLKITYRYDSRFSFDFYIPDRRTLPFKDASRKSYVFVITMRPGHEAIEEKVRAEARSGLLSEIREWLGRLYADVLSAPTVRLLETHAAAIDDLQERLSRFPDEPMSADDLAGLRDGLETLKEELSQQLQQQVEDKEELNRRVTELARDIEFLKRTLDSMTKRQWSELFVARVSRWREQFFLRRMSAGLKALKLLMPGSEELLDSVVDGAEAAADVIEGPRT